MKKKFSLTLISILSVVVLVGVGFAAWIITTPNVEKKQTGTITASGVTDARYELTATITNGSIVFGKPSGYDDNSAGNSDWFKPDKNVGAENLTATLTLTLTKPDGITALDDDVFNNHLPDMFTFTMNATKADAVDNTGFGKEVTAGRIKYPTISYTASGATSATTENVTFGTAIDIAKSAFTKDTDGKYKLTITIKFAWGDDGNPYTYFHGNEQTTELVTKALGYNDMKTNLEGVGYEVTIKSKANA